MAPKKGKKKPISNPARGFATTSIASKPKPEKKDVETSAETSEKQSTVPTPDKPELQTPSETLQGQQPAAEQPRGERDLNELSPEELEARLELSELQNIVDHYGPKVRKESSRQVTRLHTDRRVLRGQAELLLAREWLPEELMQHIIDLAQDESLSVPSNSNSIVVSKRFSQDELLSKVWQLSLTLSELDIEEVQVRKVLQHILANPPSEDNSAMIWGMSEALDWLALNSEPGQLLDYDAPKPKPQISNPDQQNDPSDQLSPEETAQQQGTQSISSSQSKSNLEKSEVSPPPDDVQVSDVESDLDPDEMLSVYLRTKARLFERNPNMVNGPASGNKKSKSRKPAAPVQNPTPGETKLQQKLKSIESDVLFDQGLADLRWGEQKNHILQNQSERKRFNLSDEEKEKSIPEKTSEEKPRENATDDIMAEAEAAANQLLQEMEGDEDGLLGGMFGEPTGAESAASATAQSAEPTDVTVRNFGKLTGISPRRTFEEACRSRDSGAKVSYKMVSATTYASRHSVTVQWSKDQDFVDGSFTPDVAVYSTDRKTIITMTKTACPEVIQSEGYVSTASLFLLFSGSPKEEKSALRLPPAFRDLWQEFMDARKEKRDGFDREVVKSLREMIQEQTEREGEEDIILTAGFRNRNKGVSGVSTPVDSEKPSSIAKVEESQVLKDMWARKTSTPAYQHMLNARSTLPMFQFRDVALHAVEKNQVTILCGETGCGKSTQMPAFILEHELSLGRPCKIYCTEPRRISAISLAQRVSEEMGEDKGAVGTSRSLVGYAIRLESQTTAQTRLVYATVGIVLRMLESAKGLGEITHLVIDEIHERSIDTDFLLIVLRALMVRRPDLKVILMSATVDAQRFSSYLDNAPIVTVPGRTFPVQAKFLEDAIELTGHTIEDGATSKNDADDDDFEPTSESTAAAIQQLSGYSPKTIKTLAGYDEYAIDYSLILKLLEKIAYDQGYSQFSQAILVFLPGLAEIRQLNDALVGHPSFSQGWLVYPLHSTFSSEEQQAAFNVPPPGLRKIVLATNIAETGITIPDVTCVVDTGKHKEMRFDERRQLSRLIQSFISRANAKQRRGRAGRVQEGVCFHLFTKYRHDEIMAPQQTPEMLRLSLQDLVMRVKICKLGDIEQALSQALDPPSLKNIRRAIDALIDVGALTQSEELTPLGSQLAKLPLDAQLGKLILLSSVFGCLDFALSVAAMLSSKTPFVAPMGAKKQADTVRLGFKRGNSDLLTAYNAYIAWRKACTTPGISEFQFCRKNFLSPVNLSNIEDLKSQLLASLSDAGFVSMDGAQRSALSRVRNSGRGPRSFVSVPASHNSNDLNDILLNSVTAWSFYPKLAIREGKGWRSVANSQSLSLHPQSVNKMSPSPSLASTSYLSFYSIMQSSSRFTNAQETAPVDPFALVLLAGDAKFDIWAGVVVLDGNRLRFKVRDWRTAVVLKILRSRIREVLLREFKMPGRALPERQRNWMEVFGKVFEGVRREY